LELDRAENKCFPFRFLVVLFPEKVGNLNINIILIASVSNYQTGKQIVDWLA
jgi:hypothetical protein